VTPRASQGGFTLLEVVVAFVLLALTLMTVFQIFTTGLARGDDMQEYSQALVLAQSKLASVGVEELIEEGESDGTSENGRYRWRVAVVPHEEPSQDPNVVPNSTLSMYRVEARVDWTSSAGRERNITLNTLALGTRRQ
jgi:general secretion pathway protein I